MSSADLYQNQNELYDNIKKIGINIKKDAWDRKNPDYFKRRKAMLENLWSDYQFNHDRLSTEQSANHPYFTNDSYNQTLQCYNEVKELILQQHQQLTTLARTPREQSLQTKTLGGANQQTGEGTSDQTRHEQEAFKNEVAEQSRDANQDNQNREPSPPPIRQEQQKPAKRDTGSNSKLDDMMRKQTANFKAFMRAVANIHVEFLSERWEFQDALQTLQTRWSAIDNLHWEIECETNGEKMIVYEDRYTRYENQFHELKKALNTKMWSGAHREKTTPKLDIPVFNGNYNQWVPFKDLFTEAIHNNNSLSSAQKMQFLKSKVQGEAERLIQHLQISSDNYLVCWDILNHRYNNEKLIFTSHMNMLFNLPNMQQQSAAQIKKIHDVSIECLYAIKNLGVDVDTWDPILVHILSQKLDADTHSEYNDSLKNCRKLPILKDLLDFLEAKFTSWETSRRKQENNQKPNTSSGQHQNSSYSKKQYSSNQATSNKKMTKSFHASTFRCPLCDGEHGMYNCAKFLEMPNHIKLSTVNKMNICVNCLFSHNGKTCTSTYRCRNCAGQHNTLMHEACTKNKTEKQTNSSHVSKDDDTSEILLATAVVNIETADGTQIKLRALIDQGSQISLITEHAAQLLGVKRERCKGVIFGVGQKENHCKGMTTINCSSVYNDFKFQTSVFIMNNLIKNLPNKTFAKPSWSHIQNIHLADPDFHNSRQVDLLFGADIYSQIMLGGIIKGDDVTQPIAQQTYLGWLLCGNVKTFQCNVVINNLEDIKQFWETEDITDQSNLSVENETCIDYYTNTTQRLESGKYEVRLPMKNELDSRLGSSKPMAIAQFKTLERKLEKQTNLAKAYKDFMAEYIDLGHMKQSTVSNKTVECYLPHHGVQRAESTTTKYRVVFNASAKTSTGCSLNDLMYKGPNLQQDLQTLLIKWRQYKYAFTADIEKMFRAIWVAPADQQLQQIVWRESPKQPIRSYQLTTVTYGTKAAPFLAMMTLKRLATDEREQFPEASKVLEESFYMDDLVHGTHTIENGKKLIADLKQLLKNGGFNLRKWSANNQELLEDISEQHNNDKIVFNFRTENTLKTLGLCWNSREDKFTFQCAISNVNKKQTKRSLLAEISKLFDPLGWLAPVSTKLKLLFQKLWDGNSLWDDEVSDNIHAEWCKIQADVTAINSCEIPRWLQCGEKQKMELHGFSDASLDAYACVIYARVHSSTILVAAKSKIVPHRKTTTLPRLELNGAHLLSQLMRKVKQSLNQYEIHVYGWTDSMVVLGWLQGDPSRWKAFVENRVRSITDVIPQSSWNYVRTKENPADAASRGQYASQLKENQLWWKGPTWLPSLKTNNIEKHNYNTDQEEKTVRKKVNVSQHNIENPSIVEKLLQNHSSIEHIIRIVAWILRPLNPKRRQLPRYLTLHELDNATKVIVKQTQQKSFDTDICYLQKHNTVQSNSKIKALTPFIDHQDILRVGGRLKNASLTENMKHPMIIPHDSRLTHLLIDQAHRMTFHGGPRLTLSHLREKYWIVGGNRATKMQVRKCVTCRKNNPKAEHQLMGNLPSARANQAPPFYHTGVDYTGFVDVKMNKGRGAKTTKGYIAVFICMVTKAVHIELVSDLTSSAFLAALNRMAARRGTPRHLYSDNGTNFVGANRQLVEQYEEIEHIYKGDQLQREIAEMRIEWHFNAPAWPSAGGLWERAVRSLKHHLKRVVGVQKLTFEEYTTILTKLEACLNSRPLCPLSENTDDLDCLTPAHFLSGRPGLTVIETREDARTRWELTRKIFVEIWKRWKNEYLCQLLARSKWQEPQKNLKIGDLVVIHDDHIPVGKWLMGRITELHPGNDGYVRVVSLKTRNGHMKRPVTKLSALPIKGDETAEQQTTSKTNNESYLQMNSESQKARRGKTTNRNINFIGLVMAMLYLLNPVAATNTTNIAELQQGLYFDKVTNMQLIRGEWKIIVYYDVKPYWHGIAVSSKFTNHLENICEKIRQKTQCNVILTQLQHSIDEIRHYNHMLLNPQGRVNTRSKRGFINGVGSIARSLFGVLDDEFAKQYQADIDLVKANEKHLALLLRNQTSVIEAEYNLLKRSEDAVDKQYKLFNQHLLNLEKFTNDLKKELDSQELSIEFVMSAITANSLTEHLRNVQETLIDTVTNIYNGKINLHLIAPEQLRDELNIISGQLSKDLVLPINNIQTELFRLYHLLQVKAKMTEQYLIIEVKVPLISRDNFEIYRTIPIPKNNDVGMVTLIPIAEFLAINIQKDSYIPMTESEIHQCAQNDATTQLCSLLKPIYRMKSDESLCMKNKESLHCETKHETCRDMWLELNNVNNYVYFCCQQCKIRIICGHQVSTQLLYKAGVITLNDDCIISSETFAVYPQKQQTNKIQAQVDAGPAEIPSINNIINLPVPVLKHHHENETVTEQRALLQRLGKQIEQLKAATSEDILSDRATYHDVHQYVVIYLLAAAATLVGVIYAYNHLRKHWASRRKPEAPSVPNPIPRRRSTASIVNNSLCDVTDDTCATHLSSARALNKATSPIARCELP